MIKLGVIFGGISTESEISKKSATSILRKLNKNKYEIYPIYIDKSGIWYECKEDYNIINLDEKINNIIKIENTEKYIKQLDVVFPVLHGLGGEDGTIQGLFEMYGIPYVGCGVLASSIGMDKVYTKVIFEKAKINQADYIYIRKNKNKFIYVNENFDEEILEIEKIAEKIIEKLKFPMFVKPSNSGSSVGVNKANNKEQLIKNIKFAGIYDNKILVEQGIDGNEVECAVLGNDNVIASCIGEIMPAEEFYSFDAKYEMKESKTIIPAEIDNELSDKIRKLAIKAFKAIDGKGLSRVDFFIEKNTNKIYINEINTLPGFTNISMYPQLFRKSGIEYGKLLDKLIEYALENE